MDKKKATLLLEDGTKWNGFSFGADTNVSGEVVFSTGMVGYNEMLTDPSYHGQILVMAYPLIGNYGVPCEEKTENGVSTNFESDGIKTAGLIISDYSESFSHHSAKKSLSKWLCENNIPAIFGIDTRALTKHIREKGVMLGKMVNDKTIADPNDSDDKDVGFDDPNKKNLAKQVCTEKKMTYGKGKYTVAVIDCGIKNNILRSLLKRDVTIIRVPTGHDFLQNSLFDKIDGILVSNGPGDPKQCTGAINSVKQAIKRNIPVFGICLGNQILALASGADTYKLKYGHRSQNQPCILYEKEEGQERLRCFITSQNHGYAIDTSTLQPGWREWFVNANDTTNEGIIHESGLFMAVQFHPESNPGPTDTSFLFDRFVENVKQYSEKKTTQEVENE